MVTVEADRGRVEPRLGSGRVECPDCPAAPRSHGEPIPPDRGRRLDARDKSAIHGGPGERTLSGEEAL